MIKKAWAYGRLGDSPSDMYFTSFGLEDIMESLDECRGDPTRVEVYEITFDGPCSLVRWLGWWENYEFHSSER